MTFSSKAVQDLLARGFRSARHDLDGEAAAGASYAHGPADPAPGCVRGNGEHNVQSLFLTPTGEILHAVAGFVGPEDFLAEARFALDTWKEVDAAPADRRAGIVAERHERALAALEGSPPRGPFADFERGRQRDDLDFCRRRPLLPVAEFRTEMLVGNAKTFFGSSSGAPPMRRLGPADAPAPRPHGRTTPRAGVPPSRAPAGRGANSRGDG